jgi:fluoride exporter
MTLLLVLLGGAVGAVTRYLTDVTVQRAHSTEFPWGTWTVNMAGSFVLGVVAAAGPGWLVTLAGTGFCGALTTFSTFQVELIKLTRHGQHWIAAGYLTASLAAGLVGMYLATALTRRVRIA